MTQVASVLKDILHLTALVDSAESILDGIDLTPLLVYLIDTTSAEALPYLAEQFGVLGFSGWIIAETEAQQRELLKKALELQRYKGTPWAIKEILKAVGFGGATITEGGTGFAPLYDGEFIYNGEITYAPSADYDWALFSIVLDLGELRGITQAETDLAINVVKAYKNARSRLVGVSYTVSISDAITINDDALAYNQQADPENETTRGLIYDGTAQYNGVHTYAGTQGDSASIVVKNSLGNIILIEAF
jgi:hypothetical protein